MIAIVNVSETYKKGIQTYEVRINREVITTFQHDYNDGLAICLQRAADAVFEATPGAISACK